MSERIESDHGNSVQEKQRRALAEACNGELRPVVTDLYWLMRLLQDENWSLWESSDDFKTAQAMYAETEIDLPGEQKALVRVVEIEQKTK